MAIAINQIVPFAKPDSMPTSPCFGEIGVSPVNPLITNATKVAAPIGIAFAIIATMVATNSASIPQALADNPSGVGINQIPKPTMTAISSPCHLKPSLTSTAGILLSIG